MSKKRAQAHIKTFCSFRRKNLRQLDKNEKHQLANHLKGEGLFDFIPSLLKTAIAVPAAVKGVKVYNKIQQSVGKHGGYTKALANKLSNTKIGKKVRELKNKITDKIQSHKDKIADKLDKGALKDEKHAQTRLERQQRMIFKNEKPDSQYNPQIIGNDKGETFRALNPKDQLEGKYVNVSKKTPKQDIKSKVKKALQATPSSTESDKKDVFYDAQETPSWLSDLNHPATKNLPKNYYITDPNNNQYGEGRHYKHRIKYGGRILGPVQPNIKPGLLGSSYKSPKIIATGRRYI